MRIAMEEVARKLTLWHTPTFRPIYTHDDLEPIMAAAGFFPLPMIAGAGGHVAWREYSYGGRKKSGAQRKNQEPCPCPRLPYPCPRLPYPRIDGLHLLAYEAFFHALDFYLGPHRAPDLFHVRSMPLTRSQDVADGAYRHMKDCTVEDEGIYVFRDGTLDHRTKMLCSSAAGSGIKGSSKAIDVDSSSPSTHLVALEDLFPARSRDIA